MTGHLLFKSFCLCSAEGHLGPMNREDVQKLENCITCKYNSCMCVLLKKNDLRFTFLVRFSSFSL